MLRALFLVAGAMISANALALQITFFDPSKAGTAIGDDFKISHGVVFTQAFYTSQAFASGEPDDVNYNGIVNQPIRGYFSGGVTDFLETFIFYADGQTSSTLNAYDIGGHLIGSTTSSINFTLAIATPGIKSFEVLFSSPIAGHDDVIGINYLKFNPLSPDPVTPTVPTPGTLPLMLAGLGAVLFSRRRLVAVQ
jgi:uncharacterized protein (TIGR03382 family)